MKDLLPVDTAVTVLVNTVPLIDDTDFKTRETSVAYNATGMDLVWNFTTTAGVITQTAVTPTTGGDYDWSSVGDGMYKIEIPASGGVSINNDTEGYGFFSGVCDGVLPWRGPTYTFVPANIINSLISGSDKLQVDTVEVSGDATAADNLEADYDGNGYNKSASTVGTVTTLTNKTGFSLSSSQTFNVTGNITGNLSGSVGSVTGNVGGNVTGSIGSLATQAKADVNAEVDTALSEYDAPTKTEMDTAFTEIKGAGFTTTDTLEAIRDRGDAAWTTATGFSTLSQADIRTAVGLASANLDTQLSTIDANVGLILEDTGTTIPGTLTMIAAYIDTEVAAILDDTGSTIPGLIAALNNLSTADIDARLAAIGLDHLVSTSVAGTDIADDSIIAKLVSSSATADWDTYVNTTDSLQAMRDWIGDGSNLTESGGTGDQYTAVTSAISGLNNLSQADIRTAVGLASANLDTQLSTIDTVVDAILVDTDTTIPGTLTTIASYIDTEIGTIISDIAALNDVSTSDVRTQVDNALVAIHLDHLLAADYNPDSKPGVSTALFNELIVSDSGVSQFTTNALENGPGGGNVTVGDITDAALTKFVTVDTGETAGTAVTGSVAQIAQGAAGSNVTVEAFTSTAATTINAIKTKTDTISTGVITVVSPVARSGAVQIVRGDDYSNSDSRSIEFTNASGDWPDLTGATVVFTGEAAVALDSSDFTASMSVVTPSGANQKVRLELTDTQTGTLAVGRFNYDVQATLSSGNKVTLQRMVQGFEVLEDYT